MFLGHFALGFAAKRMAPRVSLGTAFLAAQWLDLLWPTLLLLGVETVRIEARPGISVPLVFEHYPISHSLLAVLGWAIAFAIVHFMWRSRRRDALLVGALVLSHWLLDLVVHVPDLPLAPGTSLRVGLGLWQSAGATLVVEVLLFASGVRLYALLTRPKDKAGRYGLIGLVVFLALIHAANVLGDAPPSVTAIAWVGQAQWLLVAWGYWVDAHRSTID
jgi:hypothetical protein